MNTLSIIIPCFNEEEVLNLTYQKLSEVCSTLNREYELIFIDDGSKDRTFEIIESFALKDHHIAAVSLSRNFGKEGVLNAGLKLAKGDLIAVMDADLQDPPELLEEMIKLIEVDGYEQVGTYRKNRNSQSLLTRLFSESYYRSFNASSEVKIPINEREYRLMTRKVVEAILSLNENARYIKGIWTWVGFKTVHIGYEDIDRAAGKTKYNLKNKFKLAFSNIFNFTKKPLTWIYRLNLLFLVLTGIYFGLNTLLYFTNQNLWYFDGFTILMLIFINVELSILSLFAVYLSTIYQEVKHRPSYIIGNHIDSQLKGKQ